MLDHAGDGRQRRRPVPTGSAISPKRASRRTPPLSLRSSRLSTAVAPRARQLLGDDARGERAGTSIGVPKGPSRGTTFERSATTTKRSAMVATTFSRVSAPPPPLVRFRSASTSSAPSMVTSRWRASSGATSRSPTRPASSSVERRGGDTGQVEPGRAQRLDGVADRRPRPQAHLHPVGRRPRPPPARRPASPAPVPPRRPPCQPVVRSGVDPPCPPNGSSRSSAEGFSPRRACGRG